jgi:hypothetical protein
MGTAQKKWQLHPIARYNDFSAAWDRLNDSTSGIPFLNSLFIRNLLQVFGTGNERLAVLGTAGEEQALSIVSAKGTGIWQTWQPSQLPLGAWVMNRESQYSELLAGLLRELPGFPLLLAATQQDPVIHERPTETGSLKTSDYIETGWVEVQEPFDSYWKARSKQLQQNMRTQRSKLVREGIHATLEVITRPELVADAIGDFGRLESAGWKGTAGSAVHAANDQGRFYRAMLEDFCRAGTGRIYRYRFGENVVAVDLCIESATVQVLLKTTYDEGIKGLSLSSLMRQDAYRQIFDEGRIKRVEFYGRVMEWTKRWTDRWRTLYHVNGFRWSIVPAAASRLAALRAALRRREKPVDSTKEAAARPW